MKKNLLHSKFTRFMRAFSVALLSGVTAVAAHAEIIEVGYANTKQDVVYPYDGVSTNKDESVYAAAVFPAEMMQIYAGCRITGFKIGWSCNYQDGEAEAFIRVGDLNTQNSVTKPIKLTFGWNTVEFDTPYSIPATPGNIIVGYHVNTTANTICIPYSVLGSSPAQSFYITKDEFLLPDGSYEWDDLSQSLGALLIVAVIDTEGNNMSDRAEITNIIAPEIFKQGDTGTGLFTIANRGTNAIDDFELKYEVGDKTQTYSIPLSTPIDPNGSAKVKVPVAVMATGQAAVSISKVNGNDNGIAKTQTLPILMVPEDVAAKYVRRPLLEYYGSEGSHYNAMYYDDIFLGAYAGYEDRMSIVCHHANDQFMTRDDEDTQMLVDLADGDKTQVRIPAMTLDRSIQSANVVATNKTVAYDILMPTPISRAVYDEALAVPTFANLSVANVYNPADAELAINVSGYVEPGVLPEGEKLKLTVYLLEDNVASTAQDWADAAQKEEYGGVRHHPTLIRQPPTPIWGVELDGDGEFSKVFTTEIDPEEWKPEDMHVLALLHRSENNNRLSRQVINCADAEFGSSSIHEISLGSQNKRQRVYTLSGTEVTGSNLSTGIYILTDGTTTSKIFVK